MDPKYKGSLIANILLLYFIVLLEYNRVYQSHNA